MKQITVSYTMGHNMFTDTDVQGTAFQGVTDFYANYLFMG